MEKGNDNAGNKAGDNNVTLINNVPIEKYLECVVGSEMNPSAPKEFLKAHAVISRSCIIGMTLRQHNSGNKGKKTQLTH